MSSPRKKVQSNENLPRAAQVLELLTDNGLEYHANLETMRKKAFAILPRRKMLDTIRLMKNGLFDEDALKWLHVGKIGPRIAKNIRPLFRSITFSTHSGSTTQLIDITRKVDALFGKGSKAVQVELMRTVRGLVPKRLRNSILGSDAEMELDLTDRQLSNRLRSKAEFFLYREICKAIQEDNVFALDTIRYLSFEDDLIDKNEWEANKEQLLETRELKDLREPKKALEKNDCWIRTSVKRGPRSYPSD